MLVDWSRREIVVVSRCPAQSPATPDVRAEALTAYKIYFLTDLLIAPELKFGRHSLDDRVKTC